jgi:hypothetical protein
MAQVKKKSEYHLILSEDEAKTVLTALAFSFDNISGNPPFLVDIANVRDELRRVLYPVLE